MGTFPVSVCLSSVPPAAHLSKGPGTIFSTWQRRRGQAAVRSPMAVSSRTEVAPVDPRTGVPRLNVVSRCRLISVAAGGSSRSLVSWPCSGEAVGPAASRVLVLAHCPSSQGAHGLSHRAVPQILLPGLIHPRGRWQHSSWLRFRRSPLGRASCLSRSLWVAALPSSASPGLSSSASPISWMRRHSASSPGQ